MSLKNVMNRRFIIIGVMGGATSPPDVISSAHRLGCLIAKKGWTLLNGGRNSGVMEASARGAREMGGLTIGILPGEDREQASEFIDIPIVTGMGQARNTINVLSSDVVVACPGGAGTLSEIALALKGGKPVILLNYPKGNLIESLAASGLLHHADSPEAAVEIISNLI
jgi:uncharacterized protein (TIGR00725 family)